MKSEGESKLKIFNPATNELIREVNQDTTVSLQRKFEGAHNSQKKWATTSFDKRKKCIEKFKKLLIKNREQLAKTLTLEVGKPLNQSRGEISGTVARIDFFLKNTKECLKETKYSKNERLSWEPLGVIGNISAWNFPYFVGSNVFIPALLTGNAVLYKPSEFSTLTGLEIAKLMLESGISSDVFVPVIGGKEVGSDLLNLPLNGIFFTGSYPTGLNIAQAASKKLMKVQLELGGKDPVYVCDDIDVRVVAAATADGAFYNTGQSCCSVERIYVHQKVYDKFVNEFLQTVKSFKSGDPLNDDTYIGPLTRKQQIQVLEDHIKDALDKGATVACGGQRIAGVGNYFQPTVLLNVTNQMKIMREESFGPIIGIMKVKNDDEATGLMNDTEFGLTASVYTKNKKRADKILKEMHSGSVYWNCCDRVMPYLPWTGRRHSGMGSTLGKLGIQTFLQPKAWHG
ncbi:MAG: aldehyde dehydrogenase family protein [Pseudomonadota bacterium]|nr:aldehyde dehydrogenase family protein [Pseudomonadota bacterium]